MQLCKARHVVIGQGAWQGVAVDYLQHHAKMYSIREPPVWVGGVRDGCIRHRMCRSRILVVLLCDSSQ